MAEAAVPASVMLGILQCACAGEGVGGGFTCPCVLLHCSLPGACFLRHVLRVLLGAHRLYLRKAEVVDVPEPTCCALLLPDTGETVADVHEARAVAVELVAPKLVCPAGSWYL